MEIHDHIRVLWRGRWLIVLAMVLAGGSALFLSSRATPQFVATASVFVGPRTIDDAAVAIEELAFSRELLGSYADMFRRLPIAERVVEDERVPIGPSELRDRIDTRIVPGTRTIEASVTDRDPARAQRLANRLVNAFVAEIQSSFGHGSAPVSVLEEALRPMSPTSPRPIRDGVLGWLLGAMVGVGGAYVLDRMDTRIRGRHDVRSVLEGTPVVGSIPQDSALERLDLSAALLEGPGAEAFRQLRTNLLHFNADKPLRAVLVTSPLPEAGKTTVAANLALSFGIAGLRTLLIEADLRRPVLQGADGRAGLSEVLSRGMRVQEVLRIMDPPTLAVIAAGEMQPNPSELLGSQIMVDTLREAAEMADFVVIDAPPLLPVADAGVLAPWVDGVVLVLRAGRTTNASARAAAEAVNAVGGRLLGVVLNGTTRESRYADYAHYYDYYWSAHAPRRERRAAAWSQAPGSGRQGRRSVPDGEPADVPPRGRALVQSREPVVPSGTRDSAGDEAAADAAGSEDGIRVWRGRRSGRGSP